MPSECKRDWTKDYICAALITVSFDGRGHFFSPYKFQVNHRDAKVPDQNPIFLPVAKHITDKSELKYLIHITHTYA